MRIDSAEDDGEWVPVICRVMTGLVMCRGVKANSKRRLQSRSAADTRCTSSRPPADELQGSHLIKALTPARLTNRQASAPQYQLSSLPDLVFLNQQVLVGVN
jgi:hypothetical protein